VWALDFMFDTTTDGRPFKVLSMCDEFTRESVGGRLGRSITADDVVAALDQLRLQRGAPEYIRCDNGPEFIAAAIRDWCRFSGTGTSEGTRVRPGRTPTWKASTAKLGTSSSPGRSSTPSWRPGSSTGTGATPTICTVPTVRWDYSRLRSSQRLSATRNSHPLWTNKWGPLTTVGLDCNVPGAVQIVLICSALARLKLSCRLI